MRMSMKLATVTALSAGSLALGVAGTTTPASAATQVQDGLVNVAVGDVSVLDNANIGVVAQVAATVCDVKVGPVAVLATNVDATSISRTVCMTSNGPVTISQNP